VVCTKNDRHRGPDPLDLASKNVPSSANATRVSAFCAFAQAAPSVTMCWELAFFPPGDTLFAEALDIHPAGTKSMTTGDVIDYIHLTVTD
jgi:hypothetical protein